MPTPCSPAVQSPSSAVEVRVADWTDRPGAAGRAWPSEHAIGMICRAFPAARRQTATAVDVGCGNGRNSIAIAQLGFGRVVSIDVNAALLGAARDAAGRAGVAIETHRATADALPLGDASADLVLCWGLLFVLGGGGATRAALAEATRVLRPGGVLIADWRTTDDGLRTPDAERIIDDTYRLPMDAPAGLGGVVCSFWRREQVEALLNGAGLSLVALQRYELRDCLSERSFSWWQTCARLFGN